MTTPTSWPYHFANAGYAYEYSHTLIFSVCKNINNNNNLICRHAIPLEFVIKDWLSPSVKTSSSPLHFQKIFFLYTVPKTNAFCFHHIIHYKIVTIYLQCLLKSCTTPYILGYTRSPSKARGSGPSVHSYIYIAHIAVPMALL